MHQEPGQEGREVPECRRYLLYVLKGDPEEWRSDGQEDVGPVDLHQREDAGGADHAEVADDLVLHQPVHQSDPHRGDQLLPVVARVSRDQVQDSVGRAQSRSSLS